MVVERLPQPTAGASGKTSMVAALLNVVCPASGDALRGLLNQRIERGLEILIDEVRLAGRERLDDLSKEQMEFFLPQAYRFAEQVRIGDYAHNLRVIAKVIASEL